ncbi:unnamed protein product [Soboliphyme baturini]|uniref:ABC transmembrane type-1 domain-containing protein n=1 Tax=Soboliphyme baturini TaxID=241478 RepID=A0A183IHE5_9BILA|nr:unnamed protein product [Soboliphyme baturini]
MQVQCRQRGVITSGVLFVSYVVFAVCGFAEFKKDVESIQQADQADREDLVTYIIYYILILVQVVLCTWADKPTPYQSICDNNKPSPEKFASFLNCMLFTWFTGIAILGWKRPLLQGDIWSLNEEHVAHNVLKRWKPRWDRKLAKYATSKQEVSQMNKIDGKLKEPSPPSIVATLFSIFKFPFLTAMILKTSADLIQFAGPQLLHLLINFTENRNAPDWLGYAYAVLMFVSAFLYTILAHQHMFLMSKLGMDVRSILIMAVYEKSLCLSNQARRTITAGEMVNLMSVDVQFFTDISTYLCLIFSAPLQIILATFFLWQILGPSVLAGIGVVILLVPLNYCASSLQRRYQAAQMKFKDMRMKILSEILNGIKVIKLYAWEPSFNQQVADIRAKELNVLKKSAFVGSFISLTWTTAPVLVAVVIFATYVLSDANHKLTPQTAFVSLSLLNILRMPLTLVPIIISYLVQASVSNERLKKFLAAEEMDPTVVERDRSPEKGIKVEKGSFLWEKEQKPNEKNDSVFVLKDINLSVRNGEFIAVVGSVGCGKSSLISAILGEMEKLHGRVSVTGSIAYVPQQAWIQNLTLRNNILFGKKYRPDVYNRVVGACALQKDLELLPGGDQTEIGEKGINLSGGQRQRISMARALYQNADIYLLDDPLSAVDSHVCKHIFEAVIGKNGFLKEKTRILVTNGLNYLKDADKIIVLSNGTISETGTFAQLLSHRGHFADLVENFMRQTMAREDIDEDELSVFEEILDVGTIDPMVRKRRRNSIKSLKQNGSLRESTRGEFKATVGKLIKEEYAAEGQRLSSETRLGVYAGLGVSQGLFVMIGTIIISIAMVSASKALHRNLVFNLMRSPVSFFDDIDIIDNMLPQNVRAWTNTVMFVISVILVIVISTPMFAVVAVPLAIFYYFLQV